MKTMKKVFVLLLSVLLISTTFVTAFASVAPAATETKAGEIVTVEFSYDNIAGIYGTFTISGDEIIKDTVFTASSSFAGNYNEKDGIIAYYADNAQKFVATLKVLITDTAVAGQEAKITLKYETTVDGKLPTTPDYKYDYATIKIGVDYTELNKQIAIAEGLDENTYTEESWKALEDALKAAKEAKNSTSQDVVDAAAKALEKAIEGLKVKPEVKVDYTELNKQIAIAEGLDESKYTEESWKKLEDALKAAKEAKNSTSQDVVDKAAKDLADAIAALEKKPVVLVDYTELNAQIDAAEKLNKEDYTEESWKALEDALKAAKDARNSDSQDVVDAAAKALKEAIDALELKPEDITPVDYEELRELIDVANGLNAEDYTPESWAKFEAALEKAIAALSADNQDDVDAAFAELKAAMEGLELKDTETDTESPATEEVLMILPLFLIIAALVVLFVYVSKKKVESK
ncbi:MAG: FIVAR domain-containing protein [Clostridia bacterium]|nr:FIVAR domain-containing protein [Clostridia bacterium]